MIAAFYSFKGGVGRSLAVAHVAWMLAARRRRSRSTTILVVDLDLEAPGLDGFFPFGDVQACPGLAGLLRDWGRQPAEGRAAWLAEALGEGSPYLVRGDGKASPNLLYLPTGLGAGRTLGPDDLDYREASRLLRADVEAQRRDAGWPVRANAGFLGDLRAALGRFTYVLLDSRTGLADTSFASTVLLPDVLVPCFRLSETHLQGVRAVLGNFLLREGLADNRDPRMPVVPVVSPLPVRGGADLRRWMGEVEPLFRRAPPPDDDVAAWLAAPLACFPPLVRLAHEPALDVGDTLLVDGRGHARDGFDAGVPLVAGYEDLLARLAGLNAEDPVSLREMEERHLAAGRTAVALAYRARRAERQLAAFQDLEPYARALPGRVVARLPEALAAWEARSGEGSPGLRDRIAQAWVGMADAVAAAGRDVPEGWLERAAALATLPRTRGAVAWREAARLAADPRGMGRARLHEALKRALDAFGEAEEPAALAQVHGLAVGVTLREGRLADAVRHAVAELALGRSRAADARPPDAARLARLLLACGDPAFAVRVLAGAEPTRAATLALRLGWSSTADGLTAAVAGSLPPEGRLPLVAAWAAYGEPAVARRWIEALGGALPPEVRAPALLVGSLRARDPDAFGPVPPPDPEGPPGIAALHRLRALFAGAAPTPADEVLVDAPHADAGLAAAFAWLIGRPDRARPRVVAALRGAVGVDELVRAALLAGMQAAVEGGDAGALAALVEDAATVAPEGVAVARHYDVVAVARAVFRRLAEEGRVADPAVARRMLAAARACPLPPEPPSLDAWSPVEGLPEEDLARVAAWADQARARARGGGA